jgi:hypothetical protein
MRESNNQGIQKNTLKIKRALKGFGQTDNIV